MTRVRMINWGKYMISDLDIINVSGSKWKG